MAGSTTRRSMALLRGELRGRAAECDIRVAEELFALVVLLNQVPQLRVVLSNEAVPPAAKEKLLERLFSSDISPITLHLLRVLAARSWSCPGDLPQVVEELGLRTLSLGAKDPEHLSAELFAVSRALEGNPELELTLSSRLVSSSAKLALLTRLFSQRISTTAMTVISHMAAAPGRRRFPAALNYVAKILADQAGADVASVAVAQPLSREHRRHIQEQLAAANGRPVYLQEKVHRGVSGGARVRLGSRVVDGTVKAKLNHFRRQLGCPEKSENQRQPAHRSASTTHPF